MIDMDRQYELAAMAGSASVAETLARFYKAERERHKLDSLILRCSEPDRARKFVCRLFN